MFSIPFFSLVYIVERLIFQDSFLDAKVAAKIEKTIQLVSCTDYQNQILHTLLGATNKSILLKIRSVEMIFSSQCFLQKRTNEFYFTTMKPQVDLFSFVFWRKLKIPKRHYEINW